MPGRLKLLVIAHLLLSCAGVVQFRLFYDLLWLPLVTAVSSIAFAQIMLLAIWLGMGSGGVTRRSFTALLGCAYLAIWPALASLWLPQATDSDGMSFGGNFAPALGIYCLFTALFSAIFLVIRWKFAELKITADEATSKTGPQFSVFQILLITTVTCLALSLIRGALTTAISSTWHSAALYGMIISNFLLAVVGVPWAILSRGRMRWRVLSVLVSVLAMGLALSYASYTAIEVQYQWHWWWLFLGQAVAIGVVPAVVLIASLAVVRSCGYRFVSKRAQGAAPFPFQPDPLQFEPTFLNSRTTD